MFKASNGQQARNQNSVRKQPASASIKATAFAMASRELTGDAKHYDQLENQDSGSENISSRTNIHSTHTEEVPGTAIRRRRLPAPSPSPVRAMSLVGLKNLFFHKTVTPVPARKSNCDYPSAYPANARGPLDWSNVSNQPLLRANDPTTQSLNSNSTLDGRAVSQGSDTDVESQDSKMEKANQRKGFRVDARVISDATIGLSDGLTVPFALTAGLSALGNTRVVIYGGFAELIAGAISMGLGGYLGAKSEAASYKAQREETEEMIAMDPQSVLADVAEVFEPYHLPKHTMEDLTRHLAESPRLVDFVMQFQHCAEKPASSRAITSAVTIALAYFFGGLLPLIPYFCVGRNQVYEGLYISIGVMVVALFVFGYVKTCIVVGWDGGRNIRGGCYGGVQMVVVGSAAAGAAMGLVRLFNGEEGRVSGV